MPRAVFPQSVFEQYYNLVNAQTGSTQAKKLQSAYVVMRQEYRSKLDDLPAESYLSRKFSEIKAEKQREAEAAADSANSDLTDSDSGTDSDGSSICCFAKKKKKSTPAPPRVDFDVPALNPQEVTFLSNLPVATVYPCLVNRKPAAWIFNNYKFSDGSERIGSTIGIDKFIKYLRVHNYEVRLFENLTAAQIEQRSWEFRQLRHHQRADRALCLYNTHGYQDVIYGSDFLPVSTQSLTFDILSSPQLKDKLKIIVFVACRGYDARYKVPEHRCQNARTHLDSCVIHSTVYGHTSLRSEDDGCRFLTEWTKQLVEKGASECIETVMKAVRTELAKQPRTVGKARKKVIKYQIPEITEVLRKKAYLPMIIRR